MARSSKTIGVLYSGGLDSAVLISQLIRRGYEVWPVYTQCGLPWEKTEKYWARKFLQSIRTKKLKPLTIVQLRLEGAYNTSWSQTGRTPGAKSRNEEVFLPARNLLLIVKSLLALSSKGVWNVCIGTLKGNPFPDATSKYFRMVQKVLDQSFRHPVQISAPLRTFTKTQLLQASKDYPLSLSFSCINPKGKLHCGACNKCAERRKAFKKAGIPDKTAYKNQSKK